MIFLLLSITSVFCYKFPLKKSEVSKSNAKLKILSLEIVDMINMYNIEYSIEVGFGTPPQQLSLSISLLSNFTWVPSTDCYCHESLTQFESTGSSSFKPSGNTSTTYFLLGKVSGEFVTDTLTIGDLLIENERFLLAESDSDFYQMTSDGGFGLLLYPKVNFIEKLHKLELIAQPVFSFYLTNSDIYNSLFDTFTIGEYDFTTYGNGDNPTVIQVYHDSAWVSKIQGFSVGQKSQVSDSYVYFEVGLHLIVIPNENYKSFINEITALGNQCDTTDLAICKCEFGKYSKYPDLRFKIDGNDYVVHAENYIYYLDDYCYLLVLGYEDFWLLGQPFFREYYTVFDVKNRNIQLAPSHRENLVFNQFYQISKSGIYAGCIFLVAVSVKFLRGRQEEVDYFRI